MKIGITYTIMRKEEIMLRDRAKEFGDYKPYKLEGVTRHWA